MRRVALPSLALTLIVACSDDATSTETTASTFTTSDSASESGGTTEAGDGDGDPGDGDGDPGDGDPGDGDPGDGDPGDGDGDPCAAGTEGCPCDMDTCDDGLNCVEGMCALPSCGDGVVDDGEECDVGNETMFCDGDCTYAICGDGYHNMLSEECDDGNGEDDDGCVGACLLATCGDGLIYAGVEECDDQNMVDTDDCKSDCTNAICGDGVIWDQNETCDDQNMVDTDDCTNACELAICGDGIIWENVELCDDGNFDDDDMCPGSCEPATCGDGFVLANVEECDDGNNMDNDGCDSMCMWENGGVYELTFNDALQSDDLAGDALLNWFNSINNPQMTDYIFFHVSGNVPNSGAWCSTRGDWYRDQYITLYGQNMGINSGAWDKWTSPDGVNWSGVINVGYLNHFGSGCDGENGSWCSEWGINPNSLNLVVSPQDTAAETYGDGWNTGNATFTIRYAATRFGACGF